MVRLFATQLLLFIVFNFAITSSRSDDHLQLNDDATQMGYNFHVSESNLHEFTVQYGHDETHSSSIPPEYAFKYPYEEVTQRSEESGAKEEADPNEESHASCLPLSVFIYALGGLSIAIGVVSFALGLYTAYAYLRTKKQIGSPNEQEEMASSGGTKNDVRLSSTLIAFPEKRKIFGQSEMESVADTTDLRSFPVKDDKKIDDKNESHEQKTKAPNVHSDDENSPGHNPVRLL